MLAGNGSEALGVGRILDDSKHRAVLWRRQAMAATNSVSASAIIGGRCCRFPEFVHDGAAFGAAERVWSRGVDDKDRFSGRVMAGYHAANLFEHFIPYRPAPMRASNSSVG